MAVIVLSALVISNMLVFLSELSKYIQKREKHDQKNPSQNLLKNPPQ